MSEPPSAIVSIIVPCFNDGKYLPDAIASAQAQTYAKIEIIVADDHSTDPLTLRVISDYERKGGIVCRNPEGKKGVCAARNMAISMAKGEYVLNLDADDTIDPTFTAKAVAVLDANPDVAICGAKIRCFGLRNNDWQQPEYSYRDLVLEEYKLVSACFFRRKDWESIGGYDERLTLGKEDMIFWLDILELGGRVVVLPETLFFYRIKPYSRSAAIAGWPTDEGITAAMYALRPAIFQRHVLDFMCLCSRYRQEKAQIRCLFSWKLMAPVFRLEWFLRQKVKRLFGRV
ncbi:MAG: glycosyltransferase family 2 protein [Deltaproteobacteria bacterium]|jgi:glycosyltransferase involved in cell wall biosynthesis|nr:glycosyltransferase family 2 protein [Deltaproteobacteria bacterium]